MSQHKPTSRFDPLRNENSKLIDSNSEKAILQEQAKQNFILLSTTQHLDHGINLKNEQHNGLKWGKETALNELTCQGEFNQESATELQKIHYTISSLKFNLEEQEVLQIAQHAKDNCKISMKAFCFLTNYLLLSCFSLSAKGIHIQVIQNKLKEDLLLLKQKYPPAPSLSFSQELLKNHQSFNTEAQKSLTIDLSRCSSEQRQKMLEAAILYEAKKAENLYQGFKSLVQSTCQKYGVHYKQGLKIDRKNTSRGVNRVIQKLFEDSFRKLDLKQDSDRNPSGNLKSFFKRQQDHHKKEIYTILNFLQKPLIWDIKDLLRGKCMFFDLESLLKCKEQLLWMIKGDNGQVICFKDRLTKPTSDVVLNILLEETICELQLCMDVPEIENEFNHKLYELTRSPFFSTLSTLKNINEDLTNEMIKTRKTVEGQFYFEDEREAFSKFADQLFNDFIPRMKNYSGEHLVPCFDWPDGRIRGVESKDQQSSIMEIFDKNI